jgi:hypothetical protein
MRSTPFDAKIGEDTVLVRLGSSGLHLEIPEGTTELAPGTDLALPFRRMKSWMDFGHRLYCNDASLGEIVLDMQDEQDASSVARMMMTLALRLRDAEAQSDCTGADDHSVHADQDVTHACTAAPPVVPVPHDAAVEQPPTSFRSRARRRGSDSGLVDYSNEEIGDVANTVQAPMVVTSGRASVLPI